MSCVIVVKRYILYIINSADSNNIEPYVCTVSVECTNTDLFLQNKRFSTTGFRKVVFQVKTHFPKNKV